MTPEVPPEFRTGYVDQRFKKLPPSSTFKFGPSIFSILSLVLMAASASYMALQVSIPSVAFHQIKVKKPRWNRKATPLPQANTANELLNDISCFFPGILYDTDNPGPEEVLEHCNVSHQCQGKDCKESSALWTRVPFYLTVWGAGLGATFEIFLLLIGKPFQQGLNPFTTWIRRLRLLNLAFVNSSIFFFSVCMTVPQDSSVLLKGAMYFFTAMAFALAPALFFGGLDSGGVDFVPLILLGTQAAQFVFVVTRGAVFGGKMATVTLALSPVLQFAAFQITTATPMKSTGFHIASTLAGLSLYVALELAGNESPSFPIDLEVVLLGPEMTHVGPLLAFAAVFGWTAMMTSAPKVYQNFRSEMSYYAWSLLYYVLVGAPSQPIPFRLSTIFAEESPQFITVQPYSQQHPYETSPNLGVPAIQGDKLPQTIVANAGSTLQKIAKLFSIISRMDYFIPQANVNTPLKYKPRMAITDDGHAKYPSGLFSLGIMGAFPEMGKKLQRAPEPVVDSFREGELLAWLSQFGIGNSFLKKAVEVKEYPYFQLVDAKEILEEHVKSGLVLDFRDLEAYEYKEDYEPYGGVAFFVIDANKDLKVEWLVTPMTMKKTLPEEKSQTFRRAEAMLISSLYFSVIAGKHLAEIHMTYNLLEVAAHNAFDVKLNLRGLGGGEEYNGHPLRLYLYIHLFSHGLAEELTTEHLVQEGAVFNQIFAMRYTSLCDFLSRKYNDFEYCSDENFEYRTAIMQPLHRTVNGEDIPPISSGLEWEKEYFDIFYKYAEDMVKAIYGNDSVNVKGDTALQGFYETLECVFNKMPERYNKFETVEGVTRFMADTTQHLVIRHQFYGTTALGPALDPRLGSTQVPKDGGTPGVDEWRSLAFVGLATAYANFVHIIPDPNEDPNSMEDGQLKDVFEDATPIDGSSRTILKREMQRAWKEMQGSLRALNNKWIDEGSHHSYGLEKRVSPTNWKNDINYMYCRPLPEDLHTGPGY